MQSPVRGPSPSPPSPTQSSGKPSILPRPSRCRHRRAARFTRKRLKRNGKRQIHCRNFGLKRGIFLPVRILCIGGMVMDVSEYVEALEALNECCDEPLMVEPLTWTTAIQGWQERARITRNLADHVADDKARQLLLMIADE